MNGKLIKLLTLIGGACLYFYTLDAQEVTTISPFKVTADLVSSYYWRGTLSSNLPNIQPTFSYTKGSLEIGAWGSTDFKGAYKEMDLYADYSAGPIKITLTDYDFYFGTNNYFDYKSATTPHIFEGSVAYSGPTKFPISISANVMFAGHDKKSDTTSRQNYSTYLEVDYTFAYATPFVGITPWNGYYGAGYGSVNGFGVVNLGLTASKNLKITQTYSLPLKVTLGFNPQRSDAYLVFGITF